MSIEKKYPGLLSNVSSFIKTYANLRKFRIPERYAEVNITSTISSTSDVESHVNWLISENQTLRQASSMGSWSAPSVKTVPSGSRLDLENDLGFNYSDELKALEETAEEQFSESEPNQSSIQIEAPVQAVEVEEVNPITRTKTTTPIKTVNPKILTDSNSERDRFRYYPIGRKGNQNGEVQSKYGKRYIWSSTRWTEEPRAPTSLSEPITLSEPTRATTTPRRTNILGGRRGSSASGTSGRKIICNELYNQGYLSKKIWEADERFGEALFHYDREALLGYMMWGRYVVNLMKNNNNITPIVYFLCKPWTLHMAYLMGVIDTDNIIGRMIHKVGIKISRWYFGYRTQNLNWR